jgi:hypothetical protein
MFRSARHIGYCTTMRVKCDPLLTQHMLHYDLEDKKRTFFNFRHTGPSTSRNAASPRLTCLLSYRWWVLRRVATVNRHYSRWSPSYVDVPAAAATFWAPSTHASRSSALSAASAWNIRDLHCYSVCFPTSETWHLVRNLVRVVFAFRAAANTKRREVAAHENFRLAGPTGLEPATSGVTGRRSPVKREKSVYCTWRRRPATSASASSISLAATFPLAHPRPRGPRDDAVGLGDRRQRPIKHH